MKWDKEQWRKLYRAEPVDQRPWQVMTRAVRDFLIRFADENGVLVRVASGEDPIEALMRTLGTWDIERDIVRTALGHLLEDGFLVRGRPVGHGHGTPVGHQHGTPVGHGHGTHEDISIRNLADAQMRRSVAAARKAAQRQQKRDRSGAGQTPPAGGTDAGHDEGQSRDTDKGHDGGHDEGQLRDTDQGQSRGIDQSRREKNRGEERRADAPATPPPSDREPADTLREALAVAEGTDPETLAIRAELERWEPTARLPTAKVASMLAERFRTRHLVGGRVKLEHVLSAIADCAADGANWNQDTLTSKLRKYCDNAAPLRTHKPLARASDPPPPPPQEFDFSQYDAPAKAAGDR